MSGDIKVTVYERKLRWPGDQDVIQHPWQADIVMRSGENHHGVGGSASEAMLNAAMHWRKIDARKDQLAYPPTPPQQA